MAASLRAHWSIYTYSELYVFLPFLYQAKIDRLILKPFRWSEVQSLIWSSINEKVSQYDPVIWPWINLVFEVLRSGRCFDPGHPINLTIMFEIRLIILTFCIPIAPIRPIILDFEEPIDVFIHLFVWFLPSYLFMHV